MPTMPIYQFTGSALGHKNTWSLQLSSVQGKLFGMYHDLRYSTDIHWYTLKVPKDLYPIFVAAGKKSNGSMIFASARKLRISGGNRHSLFESHRVSGKQLLRPYLAEQCFVSWWFHKTESPQKPRSERNNGHAATQFWTNYARKGSQFCGCPNWTEINSPNVVLRGCVKFPWSNDLKNFEE